MVLFMAPVKMEMHSGELTPIYNPGIGRLKMEQKRPDLPWTPVPEVPARDTFGTAPLPCNGTTCGCPWRSGTRSGKMDSFSIYAPRWQTA